MSEDTNVDTLDKIAQNSLYSFGLSGESLQYSYDLFHRYCGGRYATVLELGPAEGVGTQRLLDFGYDVTVVDGSKVFCEALQRKHVHLKVVCSLFESMELDQNFDCIICGHILEHVDDPVKVLRRASRFLKHGGRIFAAVPNARSLHRQAAVLMGLLPTEFFFSDLDRHHGHQRVYTPESFRTDFIKADLKIDIFGGYWLKPLSNRQIEASWSQEMIHAFFKLGERYPDIAAEIYIFASKEE
jgi:2-polyprenyl-3-methyl-5-hydroxy-6-metoxy-1,4-benzoquinol methylase